MIQLHFTLRSLLLLLLLFLAVSCDANGEGEADAEEAAAATDAAVVATMAPTPTATVAPTATATATATATSVPTVTATPLPEPTDTPRATVTRARERSTAAAATATPLPTAVPVAEENAPAPMELLAKAEVGMQQLQSLTVEQNVNMEAGEIQQDQHQTCYARPGEQQSYCITETTFAFGDGDPVETYNEVVQQGDRFWIRQEADGAWEALPADTLEGMGFSPQAVNELRISQFLTTTTLVGETTMGQVPLYEIAFDLDVADYLGTLLGGAEDEAVAELIRSGEAEGRMWIGQEDFLFRKLIIEMTLTVEEETLTVVSRAAYSGFNEPVEIPDPAAESETTDASW